MDPVMTPLMRMMLITSFSLIVMKVVVIYQSHPRPRLTPWQGLAFMFGWFGMRPALFEDLGAHGLPFLSIAMKAIVRIALGVILLYLSSISHHYIVEFLLLLVGLSLILHFGILNLSTALWRSFGVPVTELFRSPYKSKSLKEFWGKRWNIAFIEMTSIVVYRPLRSKIGNSNAMIAAFLFSGLLHEIAISLPVNAGYGLPLLYFIIQAFAMMLETKISMVKRLLSNRILSHIWVMAFLVLPLPLLFHTTFVKEVLIPLRDIILSIPS